MENEKKNMYVFFFMIFQLLEIKEKKIGVYIFFMIFSTAVNNGKKI